MLSGQAAKAAASVRLVAAFLPRMCKDGVCPAWRPGGKIEVHDVVMSRCAARSAYRPGGRGWGEGGGVIFKV